MARDPAHLGKHAVIMLVVFCALVGCGKSAKTGGFEFPESLAPPTPGPSGGAAESPNAVASDAGDPAGWKRTAASGVSVALPPTFTGLDAQGSMVIGAADSTGAVLFVEVEAGHPATDVGAQEYADDTSGTFPFEDPEVSEPVALAVGPAQYLVDRFDNQGVREVHFAYLVPSEPSSYKLWFPSRAEEHVDPELLRQIAETFRIEPPSSQSPR